MGVRFVYGSEAQRAMFEGAVEQLLTQLFGRAKPSDA